MAYRLDLEIPPADALRRCAAERLDDAIAQLDEGFAADAQVAVHEARKDVKKTRALLRLYRGSLSGSDFRRENDALRSAGRELSSTRDADVLPETADALAERFAGRLPRSAFDALRDRLGGREPDARSVERAVRDARDRLAQVRARVDDWDLSGAKPSPLRKGLRRAYARGRAEFERALGDPSDERLHEWRKRVKDLRYQQQLLRPAWPELLGTQAKAAKQLADLLGDDHDLAMLDSRIGEDGGSILEEEALHALVADRRSDLQAQAFDLGRRVYAESPKRFTARIGRYLRSAARDSRPRLAA
jgi:CHAD domain-containing protein